MLILKKIMCMGGAFFLWLNVISSQYTLVAKEGFFKKNIIFTEAIAEESGSFEETDEFGNVVDDYSLTSKFPLYAMIKAENIYLYGIENNTRDQGMILYQEGQGTYFDWIDLIEYGLMPQLSSFDYDKDGEKEVAVIIYSDRGTACLETNLYILKPLRRKWGDKNYGGYFLTYDSYSLLSKDIEKWFLKDFITRFSENKKEMIISFDGKEYSFPTLVLEGDGPDWETLTRTGYERIIEFRFAENHEIIVDIAIGFEFDHNKDNAYTWLGNVEAKVNFNGKEIFLSDYKLNVDLH